MPSIGGLFFILAQFLSVQPHDIQNNVKFAAELSHQISKEHPNGNFVFSPVSLEIVVAAILSGTRGNTNKQIKLYIFNKQDHILNNYVESLIKSLETSKTDRTTLKYTTVLALDEMFPVREQFKRRARKYFPSGKVLQMNFDINGAKAAAEINGIVANTTENKIQDLIPSGSLGSHTPMVLVNALYLKADFEKEFTQILGGKFYDSKNQSHDVVFLQDQFENLPYYQNEDVKMIRLPFANKHIHLYIATGTSNNIEETKIDIGNAIRLTFSKDVKFQNRNVDVRLPKLVMSFSAKEMVRHFQMLNVTDLFDKSRANFGGLLQKTGQKVAVSNIRHKAFIEMCTKV
uniref:Serpin domain-containing protein n=1 Tax=Romanomermis culicivorax TaxID=13658 RepID=A0A915JFT4_ROMCU